MKKSILLLSFLAIFFGITPALTKVHASTGTELTSKQSVSMAAAFDKRQLTMLTNKALADDITLSNAITLLKKHSTGVAINSVVENLHSGGSSSIELTDLQTKGSNQCVQDNNALLISSCQQLQQSGRIEIPELWLYEPDSVQARNSLKDILFAYAPAGDESNWKQIEAFNRNGDIVYLDPQAKPEVPVIVLETSGSSAHNFRVEQLNKLLRKSGLQKAKPTKPSTDFQIQATNVETTMMNKVRLADDKEPWIKGAAEIYIITSGVRSSNNDAEVSIIPLNYLDHDNTDYFPNQLVLFWDDYTYNAANIQFWEDDGGTNYQALILALLDAIEAAGGLAGVPELSAIAQIANMIIEAMPSSFFSDDDDFVDTCYTIVKGQTYTNHFCAAANAKVNLSPFTLIAQ